MQCCEKHVGSWSVLRACRCSKLCNSRCKDRLHTANRKLFVDINNQAITHRPLVGSSAVCSAAAWGQKAASKALCECAADQNNVSSNSSSSNLEGDANGPSSTAKRVQYFPDVMPEIWLEALSNPVTLVRTLLGVAAVSLAGEQRAVKRTSMHLDATVKSHTSDHTLNSIAQEAAAACRLEGAATTPGSALYLVIWGWRSLRDFMLLASNSRGHSQATNSRDADSTPDTAAKPHMSMELTAHVTPAGVLDDAPTLGVSSRASTVARHRTAAESRAVGGRPLRNVPVTSSSGASAAAPAGTVGAPDDIVEFVPPSVYSGRHFEAAGTNDSALCDLADSIAAAAPNASAAAVSAAEELLVEHLQRLRQQQQQLQEELQQVSAARYEYRRAGHDRRQMQVSWDNRGTLVAAAALAEDKVHDNHNAEGGDGCQSSSEANTQPCSDRFQDNSGIFSYTAGFHDSSAEQQMLKSVLQALDQCYSLEDRLQDPCDPYWFAADRRLAAAADVFRSENLQDGLHKGNKVARDGDSSRHQVISA